MDHWARPRQLSIFLLLFYWGLLFIGTHLPANSLGGWRAPDKLLHVLAYAGLTLLLAVSAGGWRLSGRVVTASLLAVAAYAAVDELLQWPIPGRRADVWDFAADLLGAVAGLALYRGGWALLSTWPRVTRVARS